MDIAQLMQILQAQQSLGKRTDSSDSMEMPPPEIFSDSHGYPPQWHMYQRNPGLHQQMWPREPEGITWSYDQKKKYEAYKQEQLMQQLRLKADIMRLRGSM